MIGRHSAGYSVAIGAYAYLSIVKCGGLGDLRSCIASLVAASEHMRSSLPFFTLILPLAACVGVSPPDEVVVASQAERSAAQEAEYYLQ